MPFPSRIAARDKRQKGGTDMPETEKVETTQTAEPSAQPAETEPAGESRKERLWTQSEVDAYAKARNDKQRDKYTAQLAEKDERIAELEKQASAASAEAETLKREKQKAEWAAKASAETGVPAAILRGDTEEELLAHAQAIKAAVPAYPTIPDSGKPAAKTLTKDDISAIENDRERFKAIKENIGLWE